LHRENPENPETKRKNLLSLARYGWLMADLVRVGEITATTASSDVNPGSIVAATISGLNPALTTTTELEKALPVTHEMSKKIRQATKASTGKPETSPETTEPGLPTPPPAKTETSWSKPGFWIGGSGVTLTFIFIALAQLGNGELSSKFTYHAFASGAIPFGVALLLFWYGFYFLRLRRQIEDTPTSKVRSIAMGMVEVKGAAIRSYALISPISSTPCVFYRLTRYRRDNRNKQWRVSSVSSSDNVPFLLQDETGRVEIDPTGCHVSAGSKQEGVPGQVGLTHFNNDSHEKWVEEVIVDGTLIYVLGYAAVKRIQGESLAEKKIAALRELKLNPQNMQQFDHDGDGVISSDEWDDARAAVEEKVMRESLQQQRHKKQEEQITIGKKKGRPLIITEAHTEEHLTERYFYYSIPLFAGAAAATGGAIYLLLNYLS